MYNTIIIKTLIDQYDLFIFDLDDTIVKTEYLHYKAWKEILNINFSYEFYCSKFHSTDQYSIKKYLENELNIQDYKNQIDKKSKLFYEIINKEKDSLKLIDGLEDLLNLIIVNNKKFVIVTNTLKLNLDFFITLFPILNNSSKNYYQEMFTFKKPNPECYLLVIKDFPEERKIGFEDSITGLHSLTQVKEIDPIFINNNQYYYYDYIKLNYKNIKIIENYL